MQTEYLIVGAGPAGTWAIKGIRQEDQAKKITIIGEQPYCAYSLPLLTKGYIQCRFKEEDLFLVEEDFYKKNGAVFLSSRRVVEADLKEQRVVLDNGAEIRYEKLLIATGGRPRRLSVPNSDMERIYYLRTLDDSKGIKAATKTATQAIVVGGSFIGVELAVALREVGLSVKLVMLERYIWETLLPEAVGKYLMEKLIVGGVEEFPEEMVIGFEGRDGKATALRTESGKVFEGDLFGIGVGIKLNTEFLKETQVMIERGIRTNEFLETNVAGVFAAGDVAEFDDVILGEKRLVGHIENAQFQGYTAGRNMAGAGIKYSRVTAYDSAVFGIPLIFVGALESGKDFWIRGKEGKPPQGCFAVKEGRIVGGVLIKPRGKEVKALRELIENQDIDISKFEEELKNPDVDLLTLLNRIKLT